MSRITNFILDVDGTIWDTTEVVAKAWNRAIETDGHSKTRVDAGRLKTLFGKPMNVIAENLFTDVTPEIREKLLNDCCREEQQDLSECTKVLMYPYVKETIKKLYEKECQLFIVSNCQTGYIELVLEKNGLTEYIKDFECFGNTGKQKSENIRSICDRNGLNMSETVYVGDTLGDYEAAGKAGCPFVYADYGFGRVPDTKVQISSFRELLCLS